MAHIFHIRRTKILTVRRNGARFSRMAHEKIECAPFSYNLLDICVKENYNDLQLICYRLQLQSQLFGGFLIIRCEYDL